MRTTIETCCARSMNGKYRSGSAVGFSGSPRYFTSPTTPTIVSQGFCDASGPSLIRLPIGILSGQKRRRHVFTDDHHARGWGQLRFQKVLPLRSGIPIVVKNSGMTRCTYARGIVWAPVAAWPSAE